MLATLGETVVLKLEGGVIIQVESEPERWAIPPPDDGAVGGISVDGFRDACVDVGIAKIGAVLAESPRKLRIETGSMKHPGRPEYRVGVPHQHSFIQELVL